MSTRKPLYTNLVYALALLLLVLGIFGYLDIGNTSYDGYNTTDFTVTKIDKNSPASEAGMNVGDQILTIDGRDVRDAEVWSDVPRRKIGDTRTYVVNRNGEEVTYPMTFTEAPASDGILNRVGWTMGLIFLLMALWAIRSRNTWPAFLFAMFALGFAGSFMGGPHIENNLMDDLVDTFRFGFLLLAFAFLVDFLLHFPHKSNFVDSSNARLKLYGPAVFLIAFFTVLTIFRVDPTSGLNTFIRFAMLAYVVVYFGWALVIMFRNYRKATDAEKANGLSLMFWGTVIGLVPILIAFMVNNLMPTVEFPGQKYMFLTLALVPISFAIAINKHKERESLSTV